MQPPLPSFEFELPWLFPRRPLYMNESDRWTHVQSGSDVSAHFQDQDKIATYHTSPVKHLAARFIRSTGYALVNFVKFV